MSDTLTAPPEGGPLVLTTEQRMALETVAATAMACATDWRRSLNPDVQSAAAAVERAVMTVRQALAGGAPSPRKEG